MKKIFIFVFTLTLFAKAGFSQQDSSYYKIFALDFSTFINKPIDSIIAKVPENFTSRFVTKWNNSNRTLRYVVLTFPDSSCITLMVKNYSFVDKLNPNPTWSFELFKKENLYYISLSHPELPWKEQ